MKSPRHGAFDTFNTGRRKVGNLPKDVASTVARWRPEAGSGEKNSKYMVGDLQRFITFLGRKKKKNFASFKKGCNFAPAFQEKVIGFKGYQTVR